MNNILLFQNIILWIYIIKNNKYFNKNFIKMIKILIQYYYDRL